MDIVHDLIINMSVPFAFCVTALVAGVVIITICRAISRNDARQMANKHEIDKLVEQRKLMDTRVIEGQSRRIS